MRQQFLCRFFRSLDSVRTAESKDRANLNLARFVLRISEGGVGGVPPPYPPPRKKPRVLFRGYFLDFGQIACSI